MSDDVKPITVTILDKEYVVGCSEDEREALFSTVEFLNRKMDEQRESGKVIGSERIAVMAALNVAHEYLEYRREHHTAQHAERKPRKALAEPPIVPLAKANLALFGAGLHARAGDLRFPEVVGRLIQVTPLSPAVRPGREGSLVEIDTQPWRAWQLNVAVLHLKRRA